MIPPALCELLLATAFVISIIRNGYMTLFFVSGTDCYMTRMGCISGPSCNNVMVKNYNDTLCPLLTTTGYCICI